MTTYLEKSCLFGLLCVSYVKVYQFVCVLLSLLILRVGCGNWLYLFLTIAFLFKKKGNDQELIESFFLLFYFLNSVIYIRKVIRNAASTLQGQGISLTY